MIDIDIYFQKETMDSFIFSNTNRIIVINAASLQAVIID